MKNFLLAIIIAAVTIFVLFTNGCEYTSEEIEKDSKVYTSAFAPTQNTATIRILWIPDERIAEYCTAPNAKACSLLVGDVTFVYVRMPRSWNDQIAFRRLGHEVGHALGAVHPGE